MTDRRLLMTTLLLVIALVGCSRVSAQAPTPTPAPRAAETPAAVGLHPSGDTVVASGEAVPAQEAQLGFTMSGRVQTVTVTEGEQVEAGQALVTLEIGSLDADVAQAEAALDTAQAQQRLLEAAPAPARSPLPRRKWRPRRPGWPRPLPGGIKSPPGQRTQK